MVALAHVSDAASGVGKDAAIAYIIGIQILQAYDLRSIREEESKSRHGRVCTCIETKAVQCSGRKFFPA